MNRASAHNPVTSTVDSHSALTKSDLKRITEPLEDRAQQFLTSLGAHSLDALSLLTVQGRSLNVLAREKDAMLVVQGKALILVAGQVELDDSLGRRAIPLGYTIFQLSEFTRPHQHNLQVLSGQAQFITVPLKVLEEFLEQHSNARDNVTSLIQQAHPVLPMKPSSVQTIQFARDQNVHALVLREVIDAVTQPGGIFEILNPGGESVQSAVESRDLSKPIGPEEQKWALVKTSSAVAAYLRPQALFILATEARTLMSGLRGSSEFDAASQAGLSIHLYRVLLRTHEQQYFRETFPDLNTELARSALNPSDRQIVMNRLLQISWLSEKVSNARTASSRESIEKNLVAILNRASKAAAHEEEPEDQFTETLRHLDHHIESLFDTAKEKKIPGILSISVTKHPGVLSFESARQFELPTDHPSRKSLEELNHRILRGEESAVGGHHYAEARFPREMPEQIIDGKAEVVFYNGAQRFGLLYVRQKYGRNPSDPSLLDPCTVMELQGYYGSFSRSWIFFRDGTSVVLIAHTGESRQLSNAAALLLYKNAKGERVPLERLQLISDTEPVREKIHRSLKKIIRQADEAVRDTEILGHRVKEPESIPTLGLILLHPGQLSQAYRGEVETSIFRSETLGEVQVAYLSLHSKLVRCILPRVGSSGLYGDTAGHFVGGLFDASIVKELIPHVIFSATAGGMSGTEMLPSFRQRKVRGLPSISPRGYLSPRHSIVDAHGEIPLSTLFDSDQESFPQQLTALEQACRKAQVHPFSRHYSISCPAAETHQLIDEVVAAHQVSSIDVEGGPIAREVLAARKDNRDATFTQVLPWSDDPRESRGNVYRTLAIGGVLVDNSKPDAAFLPVLRSLIDLAFVRFEKAKQSSEK